MSFPEGQPHISESIPIHSTEQIGIGGGRPYRSHKIPACDRCRKRKLRCVLDVQGQGCASCQASGDECIKTRREHRQAVSSSRNFRTSQTTASGGDKAPTEQPSKRRRISHDVQPSDGYSRPAGEATILGSQRSLPSQNQPRREHDTAPGPPTGVTDSSSNSALIVGPVMAEDVQLIQNFMSSQPRARTHQPQRESLYNTVSDNPSDPVLYLSVPRRRVGLSLNLRPGEKQREILEQILGPFVDEAISLYFTHIHPSFPVLDEQNFLHLYHTHNASLSAALVCDVLATSLIYWSRSPVLSPHPRPSLSYAWNLAVAALQEEFLAPGMSTVHAALLDLNGRPTTTITGNTINSGRTVGLAHILGLNRDPIAWRISEAEKITRVRLWWGLVIHDRWSSFAHGVPTYISKNQYEVPVPSVSILMTKGLETPTRVAAAKCFIALCTLTEILGDILLLVYERRPRGGVDIPKTLRRLETDLDNWEDSWPTLSVFRDHVATEPVSGASSLKIGFLAAKMLICRIAFRHATHLAEPSINEVQQYSQAMLRESARAITSFIGALKPHNLYEFWSPYTAYHITSATIILLRCAIETKDLIVKDSCKASLMGALAWLKAAKEEHQWDLGDICLAQCEGPIMKLYGEHSPGEGSRLEVNRVEEIPGYGMFGFSLDSGGLHTGPSVMDTQIDVGGFEYPWADLWD